MKILLLDADGVVLKKGEYFSERYSREHGMPVDAVMGFFKGPFSECQAGKKDLKEELVPYLEQWGWTDSVDKFLEYWFKDIILNPEAEAFLERNREKGITCYLASNNEHYRARKIEQLLGDKLEGYFFSADLKVKKSDPDYFRLVLEQLNVPASDVMFIDNDEANIEAAKEVGIKAELFREDIWGEVFRKDELNEVKTR